MNDRKQSEFVGYDEVEQVNIMEARLPWRITGSDDIAVTESFSCICRGVVIKARIASYNNKSPMLENLPAFSWSIEFEKCPPDLNFFRGYSNIRKQAEHMVRRAIEQLAAIISYVADNSEEKDTDLRILHEEVDDAAKL